MGGRSKLPKNGSFYLSIAFNVCSALELCVIGALFVSNFMFETENVRLCICLCLFMFMSNYVFVCVNVCFYVCTRLYKFDCVY